MKSRSNWRSVKLWETSLQKELRHRHTLWLHGPCIGTLVLAVMSPLLPTLGTRWGISPVA